MLSKVKKEKIENINFGLRDKWIDAKYNGFYFDTNVTEWNYNEAGIFNRDSNVRENKNETKEERIAKLRVFINELEDSFKSFMQSHVDSDSLENTYNMTFNGYVEPDYDDSDLDLKETSGAIPPHWYQNQAVRKLSIEGSGILDDRQMGRSNKHCIVVPNSVLANWYNEAKNFYGNTDNILFVGFSPKRDKKTNEIINEPILDENGEHDSKAVWIKKMQEIPFTDAQVVIMTEQKYEVIPLKSEFINKYAQQWVDKSMISNANFEKMKKGYDEAVEKNKLEGQFSDTGIEKNEAIPFFEDMNFDRVIVDEGHRFRNSFKIQDGDTAKLAYLPNPAIAKRATNMAMKSAYLRDKYNGKGTILLTAY